MYRRPKEVLDLARLRMDRADGPGSFDEAEAFVFGGEPKSHLVPILDRSCVGILDQADRDIRDVVAAIPGLAASAGASPWAKALITGTGRADDVDVEQIKILALITVQQRERHPGGVADTLEVVSTDDNTSCALVEDPVRSLAEATGILEGVVRRHGVKAAALCVPMRLRDGMPVAARLGIALDFGTKDAPERLTVCLLAVADGPRGAVAIPGGDVERRRDLGYATHGLLRDCYVVGA